MKYFILIDADFYFILFFNKLKALCFIYRATKGWDFYRPRIVFILEMLTHI